ncbi:MULTISPECIES: polysaccharide biosynthesis tyrosine autokinase [unclassified Novosphingobium]|uniref:GumC family protein n=1 Tax=unclassified Novosphingobium TaxID=2644732 RepID=UPI0025FE30DD|nr:MULTISPECIES: polysaccharide biosynthesis tyrosine autokinase [unclassified Novosphingobium]HQV02567.1 polysaccharide biosynthesis tyrosine autokinase [Novosphingobium sp.]
MLLQGNPPTGGQSQPGAAQPHQGDHGFDISHILHMLAERWKLILAVSIAGLVLGIATALLTTPQYRASTLMQFDPGSTDVLEPGKNGQARVRGPSGEAIATQIGLLQSESLARQVAQDLNLVAMPEFGGDSGTLEQRTDRATAILRGSTSAEVVKGSTLIRVNAVSNDPAMSARIANALSRGHISANIERRFNASSYARKFLSDQLTRTKGALEESERNLNSYAISAGMFRQSGQNNEGKTVEGASLAQTDLSKLNDALKQAEINRIAAEQRYRKSEVDFAGDVAASVSPMIQQRAELQAQYDEKSKIYKPDYPTMIELKARIDRLDSSIASERKRSNTNKRAELYGEYQAAVRIEAELRQKVAEAKGEVVLDRSRSIQYNILQREADTNRALYDALLQRYKEVGVAGGIGQSEVSLVDEAKAPGGPFRPRPLVNAIVGLIAGLSLGVGLALALQLLFDTIAEPRDVRSKLHLSVLGAIPMEPDSRPPMEALADRKSELSEAYHSVRTALKFARPEGLPSSLLVSSTRPAEGKSTSAYAIALTVAKLGSKVLLIDADLRKPTFASSRKDGHGLGYLLNSDDPLLPLIEKTKTDNLSLLPVGRFTGSAADLLSSNRLPLLIKEAADAFDMVVIDAPPVLGLADAPLLASVAEATVLVVESGRSRTADVQEMVRRLADAGAHLAGVILTKISIKRGRYGYGYGYGFYGSEADERGAITEAARRIDVA